MSSYVGNIVKYGVTDTNLQVNLTAALPIAGRCACPTVYQAPDDADADGMPDAWETQYFNGTSATNGAAGADWDGDGVPNLDEYLAGTNPTNGNERFAVDIVTTNGGLAVAYRAVSTSNALYAGKHRFYDLMFRTNFAEGTWAPVSGETNVPGTDSVRQYPIAGTNATLLFKAKARLQ
jgi:hypothetical protein